MNTNAHERDNNITFISETHKYIINNDVGYTSVTSWVHSNFDPFDSDMVIDKMITSVNWTKSKYFGLTKNEIKTNWANIGKESSALGTELHSYIELFMNQDTGIVKPTHSDLLNTFYNNPSLFLDFIAKCPIEWGFFIDFVKNNPDFIPYRTEWMVYHENIKICGTIDMVYENSDGTVSIYDWKRCKAINKNNFGRRSNNELMQNIPDCNYYHYLLQLSLYKFILETKYGKVVRSCNLVKLHPNNKSKTYEIYTLPKLGLNLSDLFTFTP